MTDPFSPPDPLHKHEGDVDLSWDARHHTLGRGQTQAAPGNHRHDANEIDNLPPPTTGEGGVTDHQLLTNRGTNDAHIQYSLTSHGHGQYSLTSHTHDTTHDHNASYSPIGHTHDTTHNHDATYVNTTGDTMTGNLVVPGSANLGTSLAFGPNYSGLEVAGRGGVGVGHTGPDLSTYVLSLNDNIYLLTGATAKLTVTQTDIQTAVPVVLNADPTTALQAATKQYVDNGLNTAGTNATAAFVNVFGDTMTGPLVLAADPTAPLDAVTKQYADAFLKPNEIVAGTNVTVDTTTTPGSVIVAASGTGITQAAADIRYINTTGDTMTGNLVLNANPVAALGAVTKQYVDNQDRWAGTLTNVICANGNWFTPTAWASTAARGISHSAGNFTVTKAGVYVITLAGNYSTPITAGTRAFIDILYGAMYYRVAVGPADNYASTSAVVAIAAGGAFTTLLFQANGASLNWSGILNAVRVSEV